MSKENMFNLPSEYERQQHQRHRLCPKKQLSSRALKVWLLCFIENSDECTIMILVYVEILISMYVYRA